jgi:hypothetical protein
MLNGRDIAVADTAFFGAARSTDLRADHEGYDSSRLRTRAYGRHVRE